MSTLSLTNTSYGVLGLIERIGPATPYQLKGAAEMSVFHFWAIPHTQLYTECARLAEGGYLDEERETSGRRRRTYQLTEEGTAALEAWRGDPHTDLYELRDPGLLKLFFGAPAGPLAQIQLERHERRLAEYEKLEEVPMADGMRQALEAGIGHEREYVRFWSSLLAVSKS